MYVLEIIEPMNIKIIVIKNLFGPDFSLGITTGLIIVNIGVFFCTSIAVFSLLIASSL